MNFGTDEHQLHPTSSTESHPLLSASLHDRRDSFDNDQLASWNSDSINDSDFVQVIKQAERAIEDGVLPVRIASGSSGSYFVRNIDGKTIGIFKPRDEEPYGRFNPKWTKWLQKTLCPCCFGRSCLIRNQGYLSEAGASIIDIKLGLNIVPKTHVVRLAADSFNYSAYERHLIIAKREINESVSRHIQGRQVFQSKGLRPKIGSFQLYVPNHVDGDVFLKRIDQKTFSDEEKTSFQRQFEKLVVLDYIIRNTDRNNSNWLVKHEIKATDERDKLLHFLSSPRVKSEEQTDHASESDVPVTPAEVHIAAIDNGLAFPFKHPDEWRAYPFHWAWLQQAKIPFSDEIKSLVLPFISDMNFVQHQLCDEIEHLFSQDKDYDRRLVERQLAVMRGQILNLAQAMRDGKSPFQLVQMPSVTIERRRADDSSEQKQFKQKINNRYPLFPWF